MAADEFRKGYPVLAKGGLGRLFWMRILPSMLGKRITVVKDVKLQQIIFSTNGDQENPDPDGEGG